MNKIVLMYAENRTAEVQVGDILQIERDNGVRAKLEVKSICNEEPRFIGTWLGTSLLGGTVSDKVVSVEKSKKK